MLPSIQLRSLSGLFLAALLFGCGGSDDRPHTPRQADAPTPSDRSRETEKPEAGAKPAEKPAAPEKALSEGDESTETGPARLSAGTEGLGTIRGVVTLRGEPPEMKPLALGNAAGCQEHSTPPLQETVIASNGRLQNAFISITRGLSEVDLPPPGQEPVVMDQRGCVYRPHVVGVRTGQKVLVKNSDSATHNVHTYARRSANFNQSQPAGGKELEFVFERPEVAVEVRCDIHPWMKAYIAVVDHPYFAISGADGSFSIESVPPGEYVIEAWHEKLGKVREEVRLDPGSEAEIGFEFSAP